MGAATDITQRAPTLLGQLRELEGRYLRNKHPKDSPRAKLPAPLVRSKLHLSLSQLLVIAKASHERVLHNSQGQATVLLPPKEQIHKNKKSDPPAEGRTY